MRWPASRFSPSARSPAARLRRASCSPRRFPLDDIEAVAGASIETADELTFDRASASLRARRRRRLGALVLAEQTLAVAADERRARAGARRSFPWAARLPWTKAVKQWRDRVMFLRRAEGDAWPDLSDEALAADPGWLAPFLVGKTRLDEIGADDLAKALGAALPWELARRLDDEAPTHFLAPTGTAAPIDYESRGRAGDRAQGAGAVRAQGASVARRRAHSPYAPIAFAGPPPDPDHARSARLLAGLMGAVRADLRGRYPRHFWPEDPAARRADRAGEAQGDVRARERHRQSSRGLNPHRKPHPAAQRVVQKRRRLAVRRERGKARARAASSVSPSRRASNCPTHIWTPAPKATCPVGRAVDVVTVGLAPLTRIAVCGAEQHQHLLAFGDRHPPRSTSRVVVRKNVCTGVSSLSASSKAARALDGSARSAAN